MTSSNIFRVTGHLCVEFICDRWIPHKGQWRGAFMIFFCAWINGGVNNGDAGHWRRHRAHYDVNVMYNVFFVERLSILLMFVLNKLCFAKCKLIKYRTSISDTLVHIFVKTNWHIEISYAQKKMPCFMHVVGAPSTVLFSAGKDRYGYNVLTRVHFTYPQISSWNLSQSCNLGWVIKLGRSKLK